MSTGAGLVAHPVEPLRSGAGARRATLGEGPVWDAERGELIWVDIDRGLVHRHTPASGATSSVHVGQSVGCAVPRAGGGLMLALRDGFAVLPRGGSTPEFLVPVEAERPRTRMNDGACDPWGRFWAGTMSLDGDTRTAALYRLDPDLSVRRVLACVSISNGIGWSPDGGTMYHVDTPRRRVDVFAFDPLRGALGARRAVIEVAPEDGRPDGLAVDAEGCLWVALWGGAAVQRYDPSGERAERVELPVSQVTSCCFGGDDLETLYVTSAARGAAGAEPLAGSVFACRPGVRGLPATPFAG